MQEPTKTNNNKTITRNITGTLVQNEKIELEITTELLKLPKPNETIKNIACLIIDEEKQICDEEETKKDDTTPNLRITKTFIDGSTADKTYHTNDLVGYKITFGNNGSGTATGVILRDLLPQNLSFEFGSAQFWLSDGPSTISHTGYYSGGVQIDEYYDLTLPPHSSGYLILTGKVLDTHTNSTTNRACILHSTKNDCKQVIYTTDQPSLTIDKTVNNSTVNLNDEVIFTIMIKNNGNIPLSGFTVIDTLPAYINFVDLVGNHQFNSFQKSTDSKTLTRDTYQETLQPNASTTVQFRAKIIQTGTRTNRACVTHPNTAEQCDSTDVKAREKQYCRSPEVSSTILWADSNRNGETTVTCRTSNGEKANIRILCGNEGGTYSENNVSTLTRTCIYKMSSSSTNETRTPVCEVDGSSYDQYGYKCQTSVTMKKDNRPELGYCGNTIPELREDCDCRDGSKNCSLSRANIAGRANGNYNNAICKNCEIVNNNNERLVEPIACFNVNNGSISINKGEMLPFYWNIERINDDELYYEEVEI
ncbi:MAG: DUF11 domain-containing protein [Candidatus Peribacteria bacterium]|nr:DUF11 domain-containing protein [Candidatus Peribacteria bacterium]